MKKRKLSKKKRAFLRIKDLLSFSIQKKIFLSFAIIIFMVLAMILLNSYHLSRLEDLSNKVQPYSSQMYSIHEFAISLNYLESDMDKHFLIGGEIYKENIMQHLENMLILLEEMEIQSGDGVNILVSELEELVLDMQKEINDLLDITFSSSDTREVNDKIILVYSQIEESKELLNLINTYTLRHLHDNVVEQNKSITSVLNQTLIIGIVVFLLGIFSSLLLAKIISDPIKKLRNAFVDIGKGKFNTRIEVQSKDELGHLAFVFNQMADDLKASRIELAKYSNGLERKVSERTKELQTRNAELGRFNRLVIGRELRMIELKKKNKKLKEKLTKNR